MSRAVWVQGDESHFYRGCGELVGVTPPFICIPFLEGRIFIGPYLSMTQYIWGDALTELLLKEEELTASNQRFYCFSHGFLAFCPMMNWKS